MRYRMWLMRPPAKAHAFAANNIEGGDPVSYAHYLKEIGRGKRGSRDLSSDEAYQLFSAMLDGGVPELELGAIVLAMRIKTESLSELVGFHQAAFERVYQLQQAQGSLKPIVIPSYNGARH